MYVKGQSLLYADKTLRKVRTCICQGMGRLGFPPQYSLKDCETGEEFYAFSGRGIFETERWDEATRLALDPIPYYDK